MLIQEIMTPSPKTVTPEDSLIHARDLMLRGDFRHLLVVNKQGELVGILSDRDIATHQSRTGESIFANPNDPVSMAMERHAQKAKPGDSVSDVVNWMNATKVGCFPVTVDDVPVGIVTTTDILAASAKRHTHESSPSLPTVVDSMTSNPLSIHPNERLIGAAAIMRSHLIRHLPVVDGENKVIGMLSDRDIRNAFGDPASFLDKSIERPNLEAFKVQDHMSTPPITVSPDQRCTDVAELFVHGSPSAMPVVDNEHRLVGILSYIDVLRTLVPLIRHQD
jgi:CBS domain-containing protein